MRKIEKIIIHCSATPPESNIGVSEIDTWHKERGWRGCGYHYVIKRDGEIQKGRKEEEIGAHCKGFNAKSIGICLVGGVDKNGKAKDTKTKKQEESLKALLKELLEKFEGSVVLGHRDLDKNKECPSFDVGEWLLCLGE
ncbi:N-acetylmuramoyl-L-alanine amidase [Helicobacter cholecystus]|uniref:N-acetylmuramoyl-L-alanine amidase n=1 Tax=Helicobacter cholecystus TaxID=45498 RepID=UPI0027398D7B|nr:N-acetylmuramoyl-L-alanine amidase [Helicobacter cholecystus]